MSWPLLILHTTILELPTQMTMTTKCQQSHFLLALRHHLLFHSWDCKSSTTQTVQHMDQALAARTCYRGWMMIVMLTYDTQQEISTILSPLKMNGSWHIGLLARPCLRRKWKYFYI